MLSRVTARLNRAGEIITAITGTMWAAIAFTVLAVVSLPAAILSHDPIVIVSWVAQTFLQLVLLPIIIVGQNAATAKAELTAATNAAIADKRSIETHDAVMAEHAETQEILTDIRALIKGNQP